MIGKRALPFSVYGIRQAQGSGNDGGVAAAIQPEGAVIRGPLTGETRSFLPREADETRSPRTGVAAD